MFPTLFAQLENQPPAPDVDLGPLPAIVSGVAGLVLLLMLVSYWKIFTKAGEPGWAAIIPIYNVVVYLKIVGRPVWWIILFLIPFVGFIVLLITLYDLCKSFGYGAGFLIGLIFLPIVFVPVLAFGNATYRGPAAAAVV